MANLSTFSGPQPPKEINAENQLTDEKNNPYLRRCKSCKMGEKPKQPESFPIKIKLFKETDAILSEIKQELEGNSSKSTKRP